MNGERNSDLMERLFAQIERGWVDRRDREVVHRLSSAYPELSGELNRFFEDLVLGPEELPTADQAAAEDRVHEWLRSSGLSLAGSAERGPTASTTPVERADADRRSEGAGDPTTEPPKREAKTWLASLRARTGCTLPDLAKGLPDVTVEFLVLVNRHPDVVPEPVKGELARRVEERWGVASGESLQRLATAVPLRRAASRSQPFARDPTDFATLLERADLTAAQRAVWLKVATSKP